MTFDRMTNPARTLALAPAAPARRGWVGLSLSLLCLLHCVGAAALVPLLPATFSVFTENEALEWALLTVSALLAARLCWAGERSGRSGRLVACATASGLGATGLFLEHELTLQAALGTLALVQLWLVARRRRRKIPH